MSRDDESLPEDLAELFKASERFYRATLAEIKAGRKLPAGAEAPQAIAFRIAMEAIKRGVRCPEWAATQVAKDWARFEDFQCGSISKAFGIPDQKHLSARRAKALQAAVYSMVRDYQSKGLPLKDNAAGKGALSIVGECMHMSPKQVERLMTMWRKLCASTGDDPDQRPAYANAKALLFDAIARALRLHKDSE